MYVIALLIKYHKSDKTEKSE